MPAPLPRPRAVLFDLFHTLVVVQPSPEFGATHEDLGVSREDYFRHHFKDVAGRGLGRVRDPVESLRTVAHGIDPAIPLARIEVAARRRLARFEHGLTSPPPGIVAALRRLRAADVRAAVVSNACHDEIGAWPRSPLAALIDAAVFSCEVAILKPDAAIYALALGRLGVAAKDAVFVGDGGSDEHRGARAVGLTTVLVTRLGETYGNGVPPGAREHADHEFADVPAFVEALGL